MYYSPSVSNGKNESRRWNSQNLQAIILLLLRQDFFPTETTKRATQGFDFQGSKAFKWNGSRRQKCRQSKKEKETSSRPLSSALEIGNGRQCDEIFHYRVRDGSHIRDRLPLCHTVKLCMATFGALRWHQLRANPTCTTVCCYRRSNRCSCRTNPTR